MRIGECRLYQRKATLQRAKTIVLEEGETLHKAIGRILAALGVLALAVGIAQSSLVQSESTGSLPHRSSSSVTPAAPPVAVPRNPWIESDCTFREDNTIPEISGHFCAKLKKGVAVKLVPPPGKNTEFKVTVPATIDYMGWDRKFLVQKKVTGENDYLCRVNGARSFLIKAIDEEGTLRVLIGHVPSPEQTSGKCS